MDRQTAHRRGYGHKWRTARELFLAEHPLCVYCERQGLLTPSTVVDHVIPHRGDACLFWDVANWQALCKGCHDSVKAREEQGVFIGCDAQGNPTSALHPWNAQG